MELVFLFLVNLIAGLGNFIDYTTYRWNYLFIILALMIKAIKLTIKEK